MKILALGDFHGTFPKKINNIIKKEKIDLVISNGDYFPFHFRKLWFKHCYGTGVELWEVIGKDKYKELVLKDLKEGEKSLKGLNNLSIPVASIYGNVDYTRKIDTMDIKIDKKHYWDWDEQDFFSKIIKKYKNIHMFTYSYYKFKEFILVGAYGGSNPGKVRSKNFIKHKKILDSLFKKFKKENKNRKVIFVSHNPPNNTKLDKIGMKAHKLVRGKHYGSKLVRQIINKHQPFLHIAGHIHESKGKQNIGKTLSINPGSAHDGEMAVVDIKDKKINVRFIK